VILISCGFYWYSLPDKRKYPPKGVGQNVNIVFHFQNGF
jgi:hypothetical protein